MKMIIIMIPHATSNQGGNRDTPMQWSQLEDFEPRVRYNALNALGKLEPAALAQHAPALFAKLEDSDGDVRKAAAEVLGKREAVNE